MNCKEFADFLFDYIEGHLPANQTAAFEQHLRLCPPCIHYLESYKRCIQMGKDCHQCADEIQEEVPEKLIEAILAARKEL